MMKRYSSAIVAALLLFSVFAPTLALGASGMVALVPQDQGCNGVGGCQSICAIAELAQNILNDAIFIGVFLAAILFAYAGFKMLVNPINPGERAKATALLTNVIIGFIVVLAAWLIVNALMGLMVNGQATLPWNQLC